MKNPWKAALAGAAVVAGLAVYPALGLYRNTLTKESSTFQIELNGQVQGQVLTFDFADEGLPKALIQPGRLSFSGGYGPNIANKTEKPQRLVVEVQGFESRAWITSADSDFLAATGQFGKPVAPGKAATAVLNFDVPRDRLSLRPVIDRGQVLVREADSGTLLKAIPVVLIYSHQGGS